MTETDLQPAEITPFNRANKRQLDIFALHSTFIEFD